MYTYIPLTAIYESQIYHIPNHVVNIAIQTVNTDQNVYICYMLRYIFNHEMIYNANGMPPPKCISRVLLTSL